MYYNKIDMNTQQKETTDPEYYRALLEQKLTGMFNSENSGHDMHHLERVYNLSLHIQQKEGGDRLVIGIAALLHDVHRLMEKTSGFFVHPKDSLPVIKKLLKDIDFPSKKIPIVLHCIQYHEEYGFSKQGKTAQDIETLILQDADNLDAIGAIGIGRTFAFGGAHNVPMWNPKKPFDRKHYDESEADHSTLHHFYSKLLRLTDNMNTKTARRLAQDRHEYMVRFVKRFTDEWNGAA